MKNTLLSVIWEVIGGALLIGMLLLGSMTVHRKLWWPFILLPYTLVLLSLFVIMTNKKGFNIKYIQLLKCGIIAFMIMTIIMYLFLVTNTNVASISILGAYLAIMPQALRTVSAWSAPWERAVWAPSTSPSRSPRATVPWRCKGP